MDSERFQKFVYLNEEQYVQIYKMATAIFEKLKNTKKVHVLIDDCEFPVKFVIKQGNSVDEIAEIVMDGKIYWARNRFRYGEIMFCSDEMWHKRFKYLAKAQKIY